MIRFSNSKPALLALIYGFVLGQVAECGAQATEPATIPIPNAAGSITVPEGSKTPDASLGSAFGGSTGALSTGETGRLLAPGQDVLKSTALPIEDSAVSPGAPAIDPVPNMTGGQGISLKGDEASSQSRSTEDPFDKNGSRLSPDIGKGLGEDPKFSRGVGDITREQQESRPTMEKPRNETTGQSEFVWLDQAKFVKAPMEAPDRVKIRWKGRDYVIQLYFVTSGDAGVANSRRTMQMASRVMLKPEQAAEALTKASEETRGWLEESPNLRVATRWEKVSPLKEDTDYYGFVYSGDQSLGDRLVERGWANCLGKKVSGPGAELTSETLSKLMGLEQTARKDRIGIWGWTGKPMGTQFVPERR